MLLALTGGRRVTIVRAASARAGALLAGRDFMSDDRPSDALARLSEQLDKARASGSETPVVGSGDNAGQQQALGIGFRIGIEFVVAILVATGLGWVFDRALGTRPFATIVMFFLGVATGMLNVYRAITRQGAAVGFRRPRSEASERDVSRND
jgi:ATP synthase protein I